ncbi:MAG: SPOR domain-containing protein [Sphingomonadales bacterium]|nr:SPOR domain-containing protein [Sphingomonadales bacterium]
MGLGFWLVCALPSLLVAEGAMAADMASLQTKASSGDTQAAFDLAQAYRLGKGVAVDMGKARRYYRQAATGGHLDAGAALALIVYYVDDDKDEGARLWQDVAVCGHGPSALMVAALYANGEHVEKNIDLARGYAGIARSEGEVGADELIEKLGGMTPVIDEMAGSLRTTCAFKEVKTKYWRVQVGAFSSRVAAARAWARLMDMAPDETDGFSPHFEESSPDGGTKPLIRLQLLGYESAEEANGVCRILLEKQHACMVVSP